MDRDRAVRASKKAFRSPENIFCNQPRPCCSLRFIFRFSFLSSIFLSRKPNRVLSQHPSVYMYCICIYFTGFHLFFFPSYLFLGILHSFSFSFCITFFKLEFFVFVFLGFMLCFFDRVSVFLSRIWNSLS